MGFYKCSYCNQVSDGLMNDRIDCSVHPRGYHEWVHQVDPLPRIPEFIDLLDKSKEIHIRKNADYASEDNPYSNFERSGIIASWFDDPVDKSFVVLIGTKLARIAELRNNKKAPNNESLSDSFLDLGTYCFLWGAYFLRSQKK